MMVLLAMALIAAEPAPSNQALVHYNARMALREGRATEAVKLWLLRNAIESETGKVSARDEDFRSVTWAALGKLGLCQDGLSKDDGEGGAGLWPLALHNSVVRNMRRPPPASSASPFLAFNLGRQQRHVSIRDVLDATELRGAKFLRTSCLRHFVVVLQSGEAWDAELADRRVTARVLRHLLSRADETLVRERVIGRAVVASRIFDLDLQLAGLEARAARRAQRQDRREGRRSGLSAAELEDQQATESKPLVPPDSEAGRVLRASLTWSPEEWMTLTGERRQFLFAHALQAAPDPVALRPLELALIDRLIESGQGAEIHSWIAHLSAQGDEAPRKAVWSGDLGRRLLALDDETGFSERAAIALHRGIDFLSRGQMPDALRSMAHAVRWSETSRSAEEVRNLSRRWLSFVASQYQVTDELFAMLRSVVPRTDYGAVLEDQLWHAALGADQVSFDRCVRHQAGRGALGRRAEVLRPLARGDAGAFEDAMLEVLGNSPYAGRRFLRQFIERLQAEDSEVRSKHVPTLRRLKEHLEEEIAQEEASKASQRSAQAMVDQLRSIIEGTTGAAELGAADRANALSPEREVFGGSLRVAPSDSLPWPFVVAEVKPPSVFRPIKLRPEEWRNSSGELVFGWRVQD
jgi:hypothetical protein